MLDGSRYTPLIEILDKALELLETEGWTRGAMARDRQGNAVPLLSSEASCFCLRGAVRAAAHRLNKHYYNTYVLDALVTNCPRANLFAFNDDTERTFEEVRELILKTRRYLEERRDLGH